MEGKDLLKSKTTYGAAILALIPFLKVVGIDLDANVVTQVIDNFYLIVGGALTLWGQFTRSQPIVSVLGKKVK